MTTADQLEVVNRKLSGGGGSGGAVEAVALAEGGLVQGWMKARRLLVIVRSAASHAVFVFLAKSIPVSDESDIEVESVLPIKHDFKCEIDSGDAVLVKLGSKNQLMFEMLPGHHTQNFVSEIYRVRESADPGAEDAHFGWATSYQTEAAQRSLSASMDKLSTASRSTELSSLDSASTATAAAPGAEGASIGGDGGAKNDDESPEQSLNRQDIAMGVTPIAARESVIKYQMSMKEEHFTHLESFTIFVGTWNVNGQAPAGLLTPWLVPDGPEEPPPDMYAVGFQELDLSKEAFVFNESPREDEWRTVVTASLHPGAKYKKVKVVRLVGMMLMVFIREEQYGHIRDVAAETVGTGIMGKLGNKGGVAVRLEFHNTSICFVCSHLAAHVSEFERRNQDYHDICSRMVFGQFNPPRAIKDHDMVYWLGDLNYRITDLEAADVKELLGENNLQTLLDADQFKQQRFQRKVFTGYTEGDITFIPTYKFDPGTDNWDSSEKARAPAWTDRVLWKGSHIEQRAYRSHMELKISDHKPVSSLFRADMKVVDPVKYRKIYEEVMKKLDRLENEFLPQVTVDTTEIIFETVKFMEPQTRALTVANTGQVPVQFEFIKKLNDTSICKAWLKVEPSTGFVMPGDKVDIALEVSVKKRTAGALNAGSDQMYDILVLHLIGGKDIFITVSGNYSKSSFGSSINALVRLTVPITELSAGALAELETDPSAAKGPVEKEKGSKGGEEPYPVPKELWFVCDLITTLGLDHENLFLQQGLRTELLAIRDWLDTGLPVDRPRVSIHSAAEALLLFLESLREPLVPFSMYARCLEASPNYLQCKQIASQLPEHHRHVFNYVTAFLREAIRHSAKNGVDPKIIATLFSSSFLRDPPGANVAGGGSGGIKGRTMQQLVDHKKARFLYHFLVNEPDE